MTTAVVGPVPSVRFHDGTVVPYVVPRDTVDGGRWEACTDHHVACDCREAERAEEIQELRSYLKGAAEAAREILAGHPMWAYEEGPNGYRFIGCMCTGCQIVRHAHLLPSYEGSSSARDEVDGLSPDAVAAGQRWKTCDGSRDQNCPVGQRVHTRPAGHSGLIHAHLRYADGSLVERVDPDWSPF